jgi:hypothetical protein
MNSKYGTRYTTTSYIEKANIIHNSSYDYSEVEYKNSYTKIKIKCSTHGVFLQRPCDHINHKHGCPKCVHNFPYDHTDFVAKSVNRYGNKYSVITEYAGMKHPISISCNIHGLFNLKKAEAHLIGTGGCPSCWYDGRLANLKPGNISKVETKWLDSLNVPLRQHSITLDSRTIVVDGFDPFTNTVYECYGSFWHGNPTIYQSNQINVKVGKTFGELYNNTMLREQAIRTTYNLITIWV